MVVEDAIRKCVVFIGLEKADQSKHLVGTAFLLVKDEPGKSHAHNAYLVTARHVVEGIRRKGLTKVFVKVNGTNGTTKWIATELSDWFIHPFDSSIDVAILELSSISGWDHLGYPLSRCINDQILEKNNVGLGDEVFIVGLFSHHHGNNKNIPIIRVGNVAALSEERIQTKTFGEIDAYLIESRSIGGLSGSPVFLNLGPLRFFQGVPQIASRPVIHYLLGLVHGHFDIKAGYTDLIDEDTTTESYERINTGIAIVVPFRQIHEVLEQHQFTKRKSLGFKK